MRNPSIRIARHLALKELGARGVIVIAIGDGRVSGASYGVTKGDCREMASYLDQAYDAICRENSPPTMELIAAAEDAYHHLSGIGWPEDADVVRRLGAALSAWGCEEALSGSPNDRARREEGK